jgi:signal transduction histidine kinase
MRKVVISGLAISIVLIMGALRANDLRTAHAETAAAAERRAANLALILSEYVRETFAAGDAALRQLALHSRRIGGPTAAEAEWTPSLLSARAGLAGIGAISVVDRDLRIRQSTRPDLIGQARQQDPVFARALESATDELIIGAPFLAPLVPTGYLIPLGRRLTRADGTVEGIVVASFLPSDLRKLFQSVNVGARGALWLFHANGVVVFREPSADNPIGQSAAGNPVFLAAVEHGERGVLHGAVVRDGPPMITAFESSDHQPLIVAVSLDREEVFSTWERDLVGFGIQSGGVAILLGATLLVLFRQMDARDAVETTAKQQLAEMLQREQAARREAEAASALKDQFVMTVSHELRTPLTAIAGWARMLVDGMVSEDKRDSALKTIERNAEAQKRLIEDLLDVSGIMTGKLRLDMRPVVVGDVVREAVEAIMPAANAKAIVVTTNIEAAAATITADAGRLQQIVWNLLSNAVKFTPNGGRVSVMAARSKDHIEITVADNGIGIADDLLPYVFDRFRQGSSGASRRHGGLGLGLAIARNLVELHGGSVSAHSDGTGRGATFRVQLPA